MFGFLRRRRERAGGESAPNRPIADATVVSATFVQDLDGFDTGVFDFTVDVTPTGTEPFRATARQSALTDQRPGIGDVLRVSFDPTTHEVALLLDDDPRYRTQPVEEAQAFNQRCAANLDEVTHLERVGSKALAELTAVTECGWMRSLGQREFAVTAEVRPDGAEPFTTSFSIFDTTDGLYTPTLGQVIAVVYDGGSPPMVRAGTFWNQPTLELFDVDTGPVKAVVRWSVPSECPTCGAPVDQSRESQAAHPTCAMCHTPLPCEPA